MKIDRMTNRVLVATLLLGTASFAAAGGLSKKYKTWDRSPEAYFLTSEEKSAWKKVQTDGEAQNFILDYKARRGPDFEKMLNERIAAADKYFSAGETKGSETLRGKVVIVFGPPSGVENSLVKKTDFRANSGAPAPVLGGGRNGSEATSSGGAGPTGTAPRHADTPTFTLQYDDQATPKSLGKAFNVELKMISNATQESWDERSLNEKFETVARASIVPEGGVAKPENQPAEKK